MARRPRARAGDSLPTPATGFPGFLQQRRKPRVIAGDIWACLKHQIEDLLPQDREREALGYVEQAAEFYDAAENPQIRSRPLLYYYSFLNVTKALLIARGVRLPPRTRHGVYDPKANQRTRLRFEGQRSASSAPPQIEKRFCQRSFGSSAVA
jgi:YaaC-like Protein